MSIQIVHASEASFWLVWPPPTRRLESMTALHQRLCWDSRAARSNVCPKFEPFRLLHHVLEVLFEVLKFA